MDQEPDVIREQIDETRSSLTEKLETLEGQVKSTVQNVKETVEGTIESVKEGVQDTIGSVKEGMHETVESVKEAFDLRRQTERHPWAMMGGAFATGFALGYLTTGRQGLGSAAASLFSPAPTGAGPQPSAYYEPPASHRPEAARPQQPGVVSQFLHQFDDELNQVKGLAIGALMGLARDVIKRNLPQLAPQIDDVMNRATSKLGGQPVTQPLVDDGGTAHTPPRRF